MAQTAITAEKTATLNTTISELQGKFKAQYDLASTYAQRRAIYATTGYEKEAHDKRTTVDLVAKVKVWDPLKKTIQEINDVLRPYNPSKDATGRRNDFIIVPSDAIPPDSLVLAEIKIETDRALRTAIDNAKYATQLDSALTNYKQAVTAAPAMPFALKTETAQPQTVTPQPAATAAPATTQKTEAASQQTRQQTTVVVPTPQLRQEERMHYEQDRQNAAFIISAPSGTAKTPGPNAATRKEAQKYYDAFGDELSRYDSAASAGDAAQVKASMKKLAALASAYDNSRMLQKGQDIARDATAAQARSKIKEPPTHILEQRYTALKAKLQGLVNDVKSTDIEKKDDANHWLNLLPDVWLLGENRPARVEDQPTSGPGGEVRTYPGPREEVFTFLESAASLLSIDQKQKAETAFLQAREIFLREQVQMGQRAKALQTRADGMAIAIKTGELPTGTDLKTAETNYKQRLYIISNGNSNGRETLQAAAVTRQKQIGDLIKTGKYSDAEISDLEETFRVESRAINDLTALWNYTLSKLPALMINPDAQKAAWSMYAISAAKVADPTFNPLNYYPAELRKFLIARFRNVTGDTRDDKTVEEALSKVLMRNSQLAYDYTFFGMYSRASSLAPVPENKATEIATERIGRLLGARMYYEYDYSVRYGNLSVKNRYERMPENQLAKYAADMKFYLQNADTLVRASGAPADSSLLSAVQASLKMEEPKERKDRMALADTRRYLADAIVARRAAELMRENVATIGNPAAKGDRLNEADSIMKAADDEFKWAFSVPELNGSYYTLLAASLYDDALHILAPDALGVIESRAGYKAIQMCENAKQNEIDLKIAVGNKKPDAAQLMKARDDDRGNAMLAAQQAGIDEARMLVSVREDPYFMYPDLVSGDPAMNDVFSNLSVNVGRKPGSIEATAAATSSRMQNPAWPRKTVVIVDNNFDHQNIPHDPVAIDPMGRLYQTIHREGMLHDDETADMSLRQLKMNPLLTAMRNITVMKYGTKEAPQDLLKDINGIFMAIYDARREELRAKLNKDSVEVMVDGKKTRVPISDYVNSTDPRRYFVVRAQEALKAADARKSLYDTKLGQNLFNGCVDESPDKAIESLEQAIVSLSNLPLINVTSVPREEWEAGRGLVVDLKKITEQNQDVPGVGSRSYSFFQAWGEIKTPEAGVETVEAYMARTGEERIYRWMFTTNQPAKEVKDQVLVCFPHLYEKDEKGRVIDMPYSARIRLDKPQPGQWRGKTVTVYPVEMMIKKVSGGYEPVSPGDAPYMPCHVMEQKIKNNAPGFMVVEWNRKIPEDVKDLLFKYGGNQMAQPGVGGMTPAVNIIRKK